MMSEIIGKIKRKHMWETYYLIDMRLRYVGLGPRLTFALPVVMAQLNQEKKKKKKENEKKET